MLRSGVGTLQLAMMKTSSTTSKKILPGWSFEGFLSPGGLSESRYVVILCIVLLIQNFLPSIKSDNEI